MRGRRGESRTDGSGWKRPALAASSALALTGVAILWRVEDPYRPLFDLGLVLALGGTGLAAVGLTAWMLRSSRLWARALGLCGAAILLAAPAGASFLAVRYRLFALPRLSVDAWRQDLEFLARSLRDGHPGLFAKVPRERFENEVRGIDRRLPELGDAGIALELMRLVALARDGHSAILPFQPATGFRMFPIVLYEFSDGPHLIAAGGSLSGWVGARLTRIGRTDISDIRERLRPFLGTDNEATFKDRVTFLYACPDLLQAVGVLPERDSGTFWFQRSGASEAEPVEVRGASVYRYLYWYLRPLFRSGIPEGSPYYQRTHRDAHWSSYDPRTGVLYAQVNQVLDSPEESLAAFGRRLAETARTHDIRRFVIDLRDNGGGDNTLVQGFLDPIRSSGALNRRGVIYTLIGRHTFSAAVNLTTALENQTRTRFVGEPTGAGPNHCGDSRKTVLPRSRILALISTREHTWGDAKDVRDAHAPHLPVEQSFGDYAAGRDAVLETALSDPGPEKPPPVPERQAARLVGQYSLDAAQTLEVSRREDGLYVEVTDFLRSDLVPRPDGSLSTSIPGLSLRFLAATKPESDSVEYRVGGIVRVAHRRSGSERTPAELIHEKRYEEAAQAYRRLKVENPHHRFVSEAWLNRLGYERLKAGDPEGAVTLFRVNSEFHPQSSNAYDSLGEGYLARGEKLLAAECYRKAAALDPGNANARRMLKSLR